MASTSLVGVLLARWYVTVMGVLLTVVLAAVAFCCYPVQYSSTATAVLVPPKLPSSNPMLEFNGSINTTALVLVQELGSPEVSDKLGIPPLQNPILNPNQDTYAVKNVGSVDLRDDGIDRPFITVTAQSESPERSEAIVGQVLDEANLELKERQTDMRVSRSRLVQIQTVVAPVSAKMVLTTSLKAIGVALALGLTGTVIAVCMVEKTARRRKAQTDSEVLQRWGHQPEPRRGPVAAPGLESLEEGSDHRLGRPAEVESGRTVGFDRVI